MLVVQAVILTVKRSLKRRKIKEVTKEKEKKRQENQKNEVIKRKGKIRKENENKKDNQQAAVDKVSQGSKRVALFFFLLYAALSTPAFLHSRLLDPWHPRQLVSRKKGFLI